MLVSSREQEIAGTEGYHCVERAISTMRLVLGYSSGLSARWPYDLTKRSEHIVQLASLAFPEHHVRCWDNCGGSLKCGDNVERMGDWVPGDLNWDHYLTAFSYFKDKDGMAHMVIGSPVTYGETKLSVVVAVEIERS